MVGVFGWIFGAPGPTVGSNWRHGLTLEHWESLAVPPGCTLGELGISLTAFAGHLVSLWMPWASKMDAAGDQADITKAIENHRFSLVFEVWEVILEAWRRSGLSCWRTRWQLAGLLKGWLAVPGAGWEAGWPQGPHDPREPGRVRLTPLFGRAQSQYLSRNCILFNSRIGTRDYSEFTFSAWWPTRGLRIYISCTLIYSGIYFS